LKLCDSRRTSTHHMKRIVEGENLFLLQNPTKPILFLFFQNLGNTSSVLLIVCLSLVIAAFLVHSSPYANLDSAFSNSCFWFLNYFQFSHLCPLKYIRQNKHFLLLYHSPTQVYSLAQILFCSLGPIVSILLRE